MGCLRLVLNRETKSVWLGIIFVLPAYRGLGYARQAVCLAENRYADFHHWTLETIAPEEGFGGFYQALGYKAICLRYDQDGMDLLEMEKYR